MNDVAISGSTLILFGTILSSVVLALTTLFKLLLTEKDKRYSTLETTMDRALTALQKESDARYEAMRLDRDFWRQGHEDLQATQVKTLGIIKDGVEAIRHIVQALVEERVGRAADRQGFNEARRAGDKYERES